MKKIIIVLFAIIPFLSFSQGALKNEIAWVPLEEAKQLARKYNKKILVFFYKENCPYCEKMKTQTLSNTSVINIINKNFFAVKIDSRTKDIIYYNNKAYSNQQPVKDGYSWRHDFYAEVASDGSKITTPSIVLFNKNFEKTTLFAGNKPKEHLLRLLKPHIK